MKRKLLNLLLVALLLVSIPGSLILASDISGALYRMSIVVSNNGTLANYVSTNGVISTPNLIAGGFLNSSANNCAVLDATDNDVPFMPGYLTNPWAFWVETIGADSYINYDLYTADTTGGTIAYFPAATGMVISDNSTLELAGNFEVNTSGWVNTDAGAGKNLVYKAGAFKSYISPSVSANVTSGIVGSGDFPSVGATNGGNDVVNQLNHTVNLPANIEADDLLLLFFVSDGNPVIAFPAGWVELFQDSNGAIVNFAGAYRLADGTEGATIVVTTDAIEMTAHTSYRIDGNWGIPEVGASAIGNNANPDPPNLAPSWGAANTLWFAACGYDEQRLVNAYPTNYTNGLNDVAADPEGCGTGSARRELNVAAENPGTFTINVADHWVANTVAIPPIYDVTATDVSSGEYTVTTTLNSTAYDFSAYSANTTIAVSMGGGLIPFFLLKEQELTAPAASVTFANIDTLVANWDTYAGVTSRHLVVMVNAASTDAVNKRALEIVINADVGPNYNHQTMTGEVAVKDADRQTNVNALFEYPGGTDYPFAVPGTTYANAFGGGTILFPAAFLTANHKAVLAYGGAVEDYVSAVTGRWADTSAITDLVLALDTGNIATGSTFWLGVVDERYLVEEVLLVADGQPIFANIPQGEGDLAVIGYTRSDDAASLDSYEHIINDDGVIANYARQRLSGRNTVTSAASAANRLVGAVIADNASANAFGAFVVNYNQYTKANQLHWLSLSGLHDTVIPVGRLMVGSGRWENNAAIHKIQYYPANGADFKDGSLFSLYRVPRTVIDRQELTVLAATISFNNIPQGYEALQILVYGRTDRVATMDWARVHFNNDAVLANYDAQILEGALAVVTAARSAADANTLTVSAANAGANEFSGGILTIPNYAKADRHKHRMWLTGVNEDEVTIGSGRWENTDPVTRIDLIPWLGANWVAGTIVELVGIFPQDVLAIEVDGDLYGIADGGGVSVPDNANDWNYLLNDAMPYMYSANQSGQAPHFTGTATSNIDCTVIHDSVAKMWISFWFKLDNDFSSTTPGGRFLFGKRAGAVDVIHLGLNGANGKLEAVSNIGGAGVVTVSSTETSWNTNQWYHVIFSVSDVTGKRLIIDGGTAVTNADVLGTPAGGSLVWGALTNGSIDGVIGDIANAVVGTDDLTTAEETGLFNGVIPADANNIWYADEGTGVNIVDYGTDGDDGTADAAVTWVGSGSLIRASWEWEYAATFNDPIAGSTDATPSFRTASSDVDVVATAVSFQPIEEAKAPPWSLTEAVATWITAANIAGNFTTTPSPTYPGASVIEDIAAASGTPAQLPFIIIFGFLTLAISFCVSYVLRRHGSRSLLVKVIIIGGLMGIWRAVGIFDFWMILFFLIIGLAIMAASKPGEAV